MKLDFWGESLELFFIWKVNGKFFHRLIDSKFPPFLALLFFFSCLLIKLEVWSKTNSCALVTVGGGGWCKMLVFVFSIINLFNFIFIIFSNAACPVFNGWEQAFSINNWPLVATNWKIALIFWMCSKRNNWKSVKFFSAKWFGSQMYTMSFMHLGNGCFQVLYAKNCIYFHSYDGKTLLDTLEVYDPKQGTWKNMSKSMAISRCDAGVTVIRPVWKWLPLSSPHSMCKEWDL